MQEIILVDENDKETGTCEKLEAHQKGLLHRAFSIFLFNSNGEMLIQKRAPNKYHSPNLWTNTCCSHHLRDKSLEECANQRLNVEMGIICSLDYQFKFNYHVQLQNDLIENEIDYVYFGQFNGYPKINPDEVKDWKYINTNELIQNIADNPENYTAWFKIVINRVILHFKNNTNSTQ